MTQHTVMVSSAIVLAGLILAGALYVAAQQFNPFAQCAQFTRAFADTQYAGGASAAQADRAVAGYCTRGGRLD